MTVPASSQVAAAEEVAKTIKNPIGANAGNVAAAAAAKPIELSDWESYLVYGVQSDPSASHLAEVSKHVKYYKKSDAGMVTFHCPGCQVWSIDCLCLLQMPRILANVRFYYSSPRIYAVCTICISCTISLHHLHDRRHSTRCFTKISTAVMHCCSELNARSVAIIRHKNIIRHAGIMTCNCREDGQGTMCMTAQVADFYNRTERAKLLLQMQAILSPAEFEHYKQSSRYVAVCFF